MTEIKRTAVDTFKAVFTVALIGFRGGEAGTRKLG